MCLTGVDYFSTLGYQPSIAFVAAQFLSPFATIVVVLLTLFGALPVYNRIAKLSPNGQGSLSVLEERLPRWRGKAFVLVLLGFAATDFVITITLSAADATAHIIQNPFVPVWMNHRVIVTLVLLAGLAAIFLKGFKEAIWLAVGMVAIYLALNADRRATIVACSRITRTHRAWKANLMAQRRTAIRQPFDMIAFALIVFPKLALGLSGFETGVAVMPLVRGLEHARRESAAEFPGAHQQHEETIQDRRHHHERAAHQRSIIGHDDSGGGDVAGGANGRAGVSRAHRDFGEIIGTIYDASTIAICGLPARPRWRACSISCQIPAALRHGARLARAATAGHADHRDRGVRDDSLRR